MKVKLNWLKELVDLNKLTLEEIQHAISLYSIEVEGIEKIIDASNIVVGRVMVRENHPDADKLSICTVNVGSEVLQIVCGAPNVAAGQDVIVAKVGAVLPGDLVIKKTKIRGVESNGMICSLKELGIDAKFVPTKYQEGIYYFEEKVEAGVSASVALELSDEIIELGVTPNRKDLLSMIGVAYELSAALNRKLKPIVFDFTKESFHSKEYVIVENRSKNCKLYFAHIVREVVVKPSPNWLVARLVAFGVRPINNVVDITNYILALYGQPLHAFDLDKLGNQIIIRQATKDEAVMTLDEQFRKLDAEDLVITNENGIVAIAGVMGASNTEVDANTKQIALEAAVFDAACIRKTSGKLNLRSESSLRFEKGVDQNMTQQALEHALFLLHELASGKVACQSVSVGEKIVAPTVIKSNVSKINAYLGIKVSMKEVLGILKSLQFQVTKSDKDTFEVEIPNRRSDIKEEVDLMEEIIRLYGYNNLPATLPIDDAIGQVHKSRTITRNIKEQLSTLGLQEVINYGLTSKKNAKRYNLLFKNEAMEISLLMPLSEDKSTLRLGLTGSLLDTLKYNQARKAAELAYFETSNIYFNNQAGDLTEKSLLSAMFSGLYSYRFDTKEEYFDYFLVKGILDTVFTNLNIDFTYMPLNADHKILHPKRSAWILWKDNVVGIIGQLHPKIAQEEDLDEVFLFEISLSELRLDQSKIARFKALPKSLVSTRDIAVLVDKDLAVAEITNAIKSLQDEMIQHVEIFDVYVGDKIKSNEKSVALSITFSPKEAITEQDIQNKLNEILQVIEEQTGGILRQ